jgi:hypothetical protein
MQRVCVSHYACLHTAVDNVTTISIIFALFHFRINNTTVMYRCWLNPQVTFGAHSKDSKSALGVALLRTGGIVCGVLLFMGLTIIVLPKSATIESLRYRCLTSQSPSCFTCWTAMWAWLYLNALLPVPAAVSHAAMCT